MCQRCNDGYDPESDYEEEEAEPRDQWEPFTDWLNQLDYSEILSIMGRDTSTDYDETDTFLVGIAEQVSEAIRDGIDSDGWFDLRRRMERDGSQYYVNVPTNTRELLSTCLDLGLLDGGTNTGNRRLDEYCRGELEQLGRDIVLELWERAQQFEQGGHSESGLWSRT